MNFHVGDRVRVEEGCASVTPGTIFTITRIHHAPSPYVPNPGKPDWYAVGESGRGVWGQFLELLPEDYLSDSERLEEVRSYIRNMEHTFDWGAHWVYTETLRHLLGMEESPL